MKSIIVVCILILFPLVTRAENEQEYYIWASTNAVVATNALNFINATGWFPIVGNNAKTGKPAPDKAMTMSWAKEIWELKTGGYGFLRIPPRLLDALGVPEAQRQAFLDAFKPTIEAHSVTNFVWPEEDNEEYPE